MFSALINDSKTAELLFIKSIKLYAPEYLFYELLKYKKKIKKITKRDEGTVTQMLEELEKIILVVPKEKFVHSIKKAKEICPDKADMMYFALALHLNCGIWSNDKRLKGQDKIPIIPTHILKMMV